MEVVRTLGLKAYDTTELGNGAVVIPLVVPKDGKVRSVQVRAGCFYFLVESRRAEGAEFELEWRRYIAFGRTACYQAAEGKRLFFIDATGGQENWLIYEERSY